MSLKFQRYISKNIPKDALTTAIKTTNLATIDHWGQPLAGNSLETYYGHLQRQNVEPKELSPVLNKNRISFSIKNGIGKDYNGEFAVSHAEHFTRRRVRVFQMQIPHTHNVPYVRKTNWVIQFEPLGFYRSHAMLWGRNSDDPYQRWGDKELKFQGIEHAAAYAGQYGWDVDIIYPHERYHTQKAYADNFNFVKEGIEDVGDEQEINLDLMTRLV